MNNTKETKKQKLSKLVGTFFRNGLRSNLDLTSLADTKAGILISINGFILTVSVTASGFAVHNAIMTYAFISIILTSLGSIIFAVLAVKPRSKKQLVAKEHLKDYHSLLFYQDMAELSPKEYSLRMHEALDDIELSKEELISHLHILGSEIKKKYFWLTRAYTFFSIGLVVSAGLIIYALMYVEKTPFYNLSNGNIVYTQNKFDNIFEPSGATTLSDNKILIVEDEKGAHSLSLIEILEDGKILELGNLSLPKKIKKFFKKEIEDLEAVTSNGTTIYAITSHSLNSKGKQKKEREKLIMFTLKDGAVKKLYAYTTLKEDLYKNFPKIFKRSLFVENNINIEGLCFSPKSKTLLIAFRAPLFQKEALILEITNPKEIFLDKQRAKFSDAIKVNLHGLGIRDITYDTQKNGYWIVAGESGNRKGSFELWFWDKKTNTAAIVKNHPNIGFTEGITLVQSTSNKPALLLVEDNGKKPNKSADYMIINRDSL